VLSADAKCFSTGGEHLDVGTSPSDGLGELGRALDDVLAAVAG
jgi:hypothetical protein